MVRAGVELPRIPELEQMYRAGFHPRSGQILMIAGEPGAGKSALAMWYAARMNVPTLYFSADQDAHTSSTRLAALLTGQRVNDVAEGLSEGGAPAAYYESQLLDCQIEFCFDSSPTIEDIADELDAYIEMWDSYPQVIVIDNLVNVEAETGEEFAGLTLVMKELHRLARVANACVIVVNHVREEGKAPTVPAPRRQIHGKVSKLPEKIWTVAYDPSEKCMKIAIVKDRTGPQDPTGEMFYRLRANPERASFSIWTGVGW